MGRSYTTDGNLARRWYNTPAKVETRPKMWYTWIGNDPSAELSPDGVRSPCGIGDGFFVPSRWPYLHAKFAVPNDLAIQVVILLVPSE